MRIYHYVLRLSCGHISISEAPTRPRRALCIKCMRERPVKKTLSKEQQT